MIGLNGCLGFLIHVIMRFPIVAVILIATTLTQTYYPLMRQNFEFQESFYSAAQRYPVPQTIHYEDPEYGEVLSRDTFDNKKLIFPIRVNFERLLLAQYVTDQIKVTSFAPANQELTQEKNLKEESDDVEKNNEFAATSGFDWRFLSGRLSEEGNLSYP